MKKIITMLVLLLPLSVFGVEAEKDCEIAWSYTGDKHEGFNIYVNGAKSATVGKDVRKISCDSAGLVPGGSYEVWATAFNSELESPRSNKLFILIRDDLDAPVNLTVQ